MRASPDSFSQFVEDIKPMLFRSSVTYVDVGAYDGAMLDALVQAGVSVGEAHLIEPNPDSFGLLEARVEPHRERRSIHLYNAAAGDSEARLVLKSARKMTSVVGPATKLSATVRADKSMFTSKSITLDGMRPLIRGQKISILKIDVEGYELKVLAGASSILGGMAADIVYIEAGLDSESSHQVYYRNIEDVMNGHGYKLFKIYEQMNEWTEDSPLLRRMNMAFLSPVFADRNPLKLTKELYQIQQREKAAQEALSEKAEEIASLRKVLEDSRAERDGATEDANQIVALEKEIAEVRAQLAAAAAEEAARRNRASKRVAALEQEKEAMAELLAAQEARHAGYQGEIAKAASVADQNARLEKRLSAMEAELALSAENASQLESERRNNLELANELAKARATIEAELAARATEAERLSGLEGERQQLEAAIAEREFEIERLGKAAERLPELEREREDFKQRLEAEAHEGSVERSKLAKRIKLLEASRDELRSELERATTQNSGLAKDVESLNRAMTQREAQIRDAEADAKHKGEEILRLRSVEQDYFGLELRLQELAAEMGQRDAAHLSQQEAAEGARRELLVKLSEREDLISQQAAEIGRVEADKAALEERLSTKTLEAAHAAAAARKRLEGRQAEIVRLAAELSAVKVAHADQLEAMERRRTEEEQQARADFDVLSQRLRDREVELEGSIKALSSARERELDLMEVSKRLRQDRDEAGTALAAMSDRLDAAAADHAANEGRLLIELRSAIADVEKLKFEKDGLFQVEHELRNELKDALNKHDEVVAALATTGIDLQSANDALAEVSAQKGALEQDLSGLKADLDAALEESRRSAAALEEHRLQSGLAAEKMLEEFAAKIQSLEVAVEAAQQAASISEKGRREAESAAESQREEFSATLQLTEAALAFEQSRVEAQMSESHRLAARLRAEIDGQAEASASAREALERELDRQSRRAAKLNEHLEQITQWASQEVGRLGSELSAARQSLAQVQDELSAERLAHQSGYPEVPLKPAPADTGAALEERRRAEAAELKASELAARHAVVEAELARQAEESGGKIAELESRLAEAFERSEAQGREKLRLQAALERIQSDPLGRAADSLLNGRRQLARATRNLRRRDASVPQIAEPAPQAPSALKRPIGNAAKGRNKTRAHHVEAKLWGGFSRLALDELHQISSGSTSSWHERSDADWALASWYAAEGKISEALTSVGRLRSGGEDSPRVDALEVFILSHFGRGHEMRSKIGDRIRDPGHDLDACLVMANTYVSAAGSESLEDSPARLDYINRVLSASGVARLSRINPSRPIEAGNLTAEPTALVLDGPKVTVIVPAYKAEQSISMTLDGILAQTWRNIEVLVIEDASPDDTATVVERKALLDDRIKLFRQEQNSGSYTCRNVGLANSTGDFITVHDAGDWSHPQKIEKQVLHLLNNADFIGNHSKWSRCFENLFFVGKFRRKEKLIDWNPSSFMFRRELLELVGGWDQVRISADAEFVRRAKAAAAPLKVGPIPEEAPLSFGFDSPVSLTKHSATHGRTITHGFRREYHEAANAWHASVGERVGELALVPEDSRRAFPAPGPILAVRTGEIVADLFILGPLSAVNIDLEFLVRIEALLDLGIRVALFNWRLYEEDVTLPVDVRLRALARERGVAIVAPGEQVRARSALVLRADLLDKPVDLFPTTRIDDVAIVDDGCRTHRLEAMSAALLGDKGQWLEVEAAWKFATDSALGVAAVTQGKNKREKGARRRPA